LPAGVPLRLRGAGQGDPCLGVRPLSEPGAVESGGAVGAPDVGPAEGRAGGGDGGGRSARGGHGGGAEEVRAGGAGGTVPGGAFTRGEGTQQPARFAEFALDGPFVGGDGLAALLQRAEPAGGL